jgi:hypothetical protein
LTFFLFQVLLRKHECSLLVHKVRGTSSTWNIAIDSIPTTFKITLDVL